MKHDRRWRLVSGALAGCATTVDWGGPLLTTATTTTRPVFRVRYATVTYRDRRLSYRASVASSIAYRDGVHRADVWTRVPRRARRCHRRRERSGRIDGSNPAVSASVPALTIALSKGRILDETLPLLAQAGIVPVEDPDTSRKLILADQPAGRVARHRARDRRADLRAVRRGRPGRRRQGRAARARRRGSLPAARPRHRPLPAGRRDAARLTTGRRRCSAARASASRPSTCSTAREHFAAKGMHVDLIKLYGSMELAPLVGPRRRDRRPRLDRQHAAGERSRRGRGHHADQRAADRQSGRAQAEARRRAAAARRARATRGRATSAARVNAARRADAAPARRRARRASTRALDALIAFEAAQDPAIDAAVAAIIADVRARGDAAVLEYTRALRSPRRARRSQQLEIARGGDARGVRRAAARRSATRSRRPPRASARYHERQKSGGVAAYAKPDGTRARAARDAARSRRPLRARRQGRVSVVGADERDSGAGRRRAPRSSWSCRRPTACAIRWCSPRRTSPA